MRLKLEHRIGIQAPAEAVWALVADVDRWPQWSGLYSAAKGVVRIGEKHEVVVNLLGHKPVRVTSTVVDWVPNEQLHLEIRMLGGLMRSVRYFEIEHLTATACIFANGEMFGGLLGPAIARRLRRPIREGFRSMGEAAKALAEKDYAPELPLG